MHGRAEVLWYAPGHTNDEETVRMVSSQVHVRYVDSVPLAVVHRLARHEDLRRVVPECCGLVWSALRTLGVTGGRHVAVYRDSAIHLEVGVELLEPFMEEGDVVRSATPAGTVATLAHYGPYRGLAEAHEAIRDWCRTTNVSLAGPNWEVYGHWQPEWERAPGLIRTDVFYLLADG